MVVEPTSASICTVRCSIPPPAGFGTEDVAVIVHVSPARLPYQLTVFPSIVAVCGDACVGMLVVLSGLGDCASTARPFAAPPSATDSAVSCAFSRLASRLAPVDIQTTVP